MMQRRSVLAIIPARAGSKRIPKKNMIDLNGYPLIHYTFEAAKQASMLETVILSSDDPEIVAFAKEYGIEVPFERPKELASDTASVGDAILHALEYYESQNIYFEYVCLLEPTSPLRQSKHIDEAIELLKKSNGESVMSVVKAACQTEYRLRHIVNGYLQLFDDEELASYLKKEKTYAQAYLPGGGIFCCSVKELRETGVFLPGKIRPYEIESFWGVDINVQEDLVFAESLLKNIERLKN